MPVEHTTVTTLANPRAPIVLLQKPVAGVAVLPCRLTFTANVVETGLAHSAVAQGKAANATPSWRKLRKRERRLSRTRAFRGQPRSEFMASARRS